jgi:hypothetical protein
VIARELRAGLAAIGLLGASLGSACDDTTPSCVPGTVASCYCNTGGAGQATCADDGLDYRGCACLPDAGVDAPVTDAAPAADAPDTPDP